jgi:predicted acyltransferase
MTTPPNHASPPRLTSLDALRGFIMFWIIGGDVLLPKIAGYLKNPTFTLISENLTQHVEWEGIHFYDLIFPTFLFILGITTVFSIRKRLERGDSKWSIFGKILFRSVVLFLLGWVYYGALQARGFQYVRILGVLQRLAIGYFCASLALLFSKPRMQAILAAVLLVAYWAVLNWVIAPGVSPEARFTLHGNLVGYVDRAIFAPGQLWQPGTFDPEGLLSTIPAIATALLGVLAGEWLRSERSQRDKLLGIAAAAPLCLALGYLWGTFFPIIKSLWTSSYALVAAGYSLVMLAAFYLVMEIFHFQKWAFFFVVIGLNPITIYLLQVIVNFEEVTGFFVKGALHLFPLWLSMILMAACVIAVKWLLLFFLYRKKIFWRV